MEELNVLAAQLLAAKAQIEATLAVIAKMAGVVAAPDAEPEGEPGCPHPPDKVVDLSSFDGGPLYQCTLCDEQQKHPFSQD